MRHTLVFFSMLVCGLSGCFATEITSLSDFNNDKVITIRRRPVEADSCGYLVYSPGTGETPDLRIAVTTATDSADNNAGWVMYHNTVDDVYYLYNQIGRAHV